MRNRILAALAVSVVVVTGACGSSTPRGSGDVADGSISRRAPQFRVETFDGDRFSLSEQRGTPVVLNFWESW